MTYYLAIQSISVDIQELQPDAKAHHRTFRYGDEVSGVPRSALDCMIRLRQVVTERPPMPDEIEDQTMVGDWRQTRVADLDVSKAIKAALADANLGTVADVLRFGAEHGSLATAGLTEAKEKSLQAAIEKLSHA